MTTTTRIAIVTGAARGIGRSIALRLADDGLDVAVNDIAQQKDSLDGVVREIEAKGRKAVAVIADVSKEEDVKAMVEKTVEVLGGVDCVRTILSHYLSSLVTYLLHGIDDCKRGHSTSCSASGLCVIARSYSLVPSSTDVSVHARRYRAVRPHISHQCSRPDALL